MVIAFPPDPGIAELAAAAPQVQFLAINIPEVSAGENISVLGNNSQTDVSGFLAGYTAAMITDDFRIGMLMPKDNADALRGLNAYASGMAFYCGICRPFYYLPWMFPQYLEISADEDKANYDAYADILMLQYKVQTIYLYPDIATPDLETYIGTDRHIHDRDRKPGTAPRGLGDDDPTGYHQGDLECLARPGGRQRRHYGPIAPRPGRYRSDPSLSGKTAPRRADPK